MEIFFLHVRLVRLVRLITVTKTPRIIRHEPPDHLVQVERRLLTDKLHNLIRKDTIVLTIHKIPIMTLFHNRVLLPGKRNVPVLNVPVHIEMIDHPRNPVQHILVLVKHIGGSRVEHIELFYLFGITSQLEVPEAQIGVIIPEEIQLMIFIIDKLELVVAVLVEKNNPLVFIIVQPIHESQDVIHRQ